MQGTYSISVEYELVDYEIDITGYEYIPVKTAEQLQKMGSGETIEVDGANYVYAINANYKLMNDIDLAGINWTPISLTNSVINGNNHKISNLTITAEDELDISEIGLFGIFSGVVQDLELENVNINIKNFAEGATTKSGYTGVGAIAGVMTNGYIINCKVSGSIVAETDNVGGFVGHTVYGGRLRIQRCTNESNVVSNNLCSNVGGIIGCSICPIDVKETTNSGIIVSTNYNAGGLVGYVDSRYAASHKILKYFDSTNNTVIFIIGNTKNSSEASSSETGKQFENNIGADNIYSLKARFDNCTNNGAISANSANAAGIIGKSNWIVEIENCTNNGKISSGTKSGGIISELNAAETGEYSKLTNCKNYGEVNGNGSSGSAGGILSHVIGQVETNKCENYANISTGSGGTGGIVGDIDGILKADYCKNEGNISTSGGPTNGIAGGIVGKNYHNSYLSSIMSKERNALFINNCQNYGNISAGHHLGGIIGGSEASIVQIANCEVSGKDIENKLTITDTYAGDKGGIIGNVTSLGQSTTTVYSFVVSNCNVNDCTISCFGKETAGIIGLAYGTNGQTASRITDCNVRNCKITNDRAGSTYGSSAGILAVTCEVATINIGSCIVDTCNILSSGGTSDQNVGGIVGMSCKSDIIVIDNCDVKDSTLTSYSVNDQCANLGGILAVTSFNGELYKISNCNVLRSNMFTLFGNLGGIMGANATPRNENIGEINNCIVDECNMESKAGVNDSSGSNSDTAGIMGLSDGGVDFSGCKVLNSTISAFGCNTAGIFASNAGSDRYECKLTNCIVSNTDIKSEREFKGYSSNNSTAGLVAFAYNIVLKDCTVEKGNDRGSVIGKGSQISGGVAGARYIDASNCTINGINIECNSEVLTCNASSNRTMSGFLGVLGSSSKLQNINVENVTITGVSEVAGGIFACANSLDSIENCTVTNLNIKQRNNGEEIIGNSAYDGAIGGIGGVIYTSPKSSIKNNKVLNSTIDIGIQIGGGLFGATTQDITIDNCSVDSVTLNNPNISYGTGYRNSSYYAIMGGLVGCSSNITIQNNSTVKNSNINIESGITKPAHIGGIIGFSKGDATIDNTKLINTTINNKTPAGQTGGIVGMIDYISSTDGDTVKTLTVSNSSVENCDTISGKSNIGGIIGFGKLISNNNTVTNSTIKSAGTDGGSVIGDVGGVIGNTVYDSIINNTNVIETNVSGTNLSKANTSQKIGGIAGLSKANITNSSVTNSEITGEGTTVQVGGIAGHSSYEENVGASDCVVEDSIVTAPKGTLGGIFGFSNSAPINSTVTGTEIKTTKGGVFELLV